VGGVGRLKIMLPWHQNIEVTWNTREDEEKCKKLFEEHIKRGYIGVKKDSKSDKIKVIYVFDPSAEEITIFPIRVGG
jgi:hypothetical protein